MRVLLFFDQTQAGAGGKERPNVELAVEKGGIGSFHMFESNLKEIDANVIATMYCGNGYFIDNEEEVKRKVAALTTKLKADIVLCGPCFNYHDYAMMSANLAKHIEENTDAKAVAMFSVENQDVIDLYKDDVTLIKMPKKGGTGLRESFSNMSKILVDKVNGEIQEEHKTFIY